MKPETIYALSCSKKDETLLIKRVNAYLATFYRTTSKAKNTTLLDGYLPFVLKYFYWNLNKDAGTWFDLHLNEDVNGKYFYPNYMECGWLLRVRIDFERWPAGTPEKARSFIDGLLSAIEYKSLVIHEKDTLN